MQSLLTTLASLENETRQFAQHISQITRDGLLTSQNIQQLTANAAHASLSPTTTTTVPGISNMQVLVTTHERIELNIPEHEYVLTTFPQLGMVERLTSGLVAYRAGSKQGTDTFVLTRSSMTDKALDDRFNIRFNVIIQQQQQQRHDDDTLTLPSISEMLQDQHEHEQYQILTHIHEVLSTLHHQP